MPEDTYEREDNRTYCEVYGHHYKEISSTTRSWTEREIVDDGEEETRFTSGFCDGIPYKYQATKVIRVKHSIDTVVYRCSRCEETITQEENER